MPSLKYLISIIVAFLTGSFLTLAILLLPLASVNSDVQAVQLSKLESPRFFATAPGDNPTLSVDHLVGKVAPVIQNALIDGKPRILQSAGNPIAKMGVRIGYPLAIREIPTLAELGIHTVVNEFGNFSVKDLVEFMENHAKEHGQPENKLMLDLKSINKNLDIKNLDVELPPAKSADSLPTIDKLSNSKTFDKMPSDCRCPIRSKNGCTDCLCDGECVCGPEKDTFKKKVK